MSKPTYTAVCERAGDWWAITVPEADGVFTQAKRLDHAEAAAREAIALLLELPESSFDVHVTWALAPFADDAIVSLEKAREEVEDSKKRLADAAQRAAVVLVKDVGMTIRDAGRILGVSYQRVDQLLHGR